MSDVIDFKKIDEANMFLDCDSGIAQELSEFFSFYVPGYKFMPAYRNKVWDGKIRLFNVHTRELPIGLLTYVTNFAQKRGYDVNVDKNLLQINKISDEDLTTFIDSLKLPFPIRDYQKIAIQKALAVRRVIALSPTGSGKSLIIYVLARYILESTHEKILVIVPTTSLVEQLYTDMEEYSDKDDFFNVNEEIHRIYSGKPKNTLTERIVISTWQSVYKLPRTWFQQFGAVFGDEAHGFKSKSLTSIMNKSDKASYRIGTTGTLDGTQTHKLVLEGLFGRVFNVTTTKELQDNDTLAKLKIQMLVLKYPEEVRKENKRDYQDEVDYIVRNEKRNKLIKNLTLDLKGNTLVLFQFVDKHGKPLFELINNNAAANRKVFFVSGATETSDREAIRRITEGQKDGIIVASLGTFSTGINIRNLHNIIFATPSKSQIKVLQSIGRGLRKSDNGVPTRLYDFADNLSWKSKKNYAMAHAAERLKIYKKEQFEVSVHEIDI
tara:strand:- start:2829 stop:4307 length:1479 start_codon:yes stop_codon:yes gene_type:complete